MDYDSEQDQDGTYSDFAETMGINYHPDDPDSLMEAPATKVASDFVFYLQLWSTHLQTSEAGPSLSRLY